LEREERESKGVIALLTQGDKMDNTDIRDMELKVEASPLSQTQKNKILWHLEQIQYTLQSQHSAKKRVKV